MNWKDHIGFRVALREAGLSNAEWSVLALIGKWPVPEECVAMTAASHSEGDPLGHTAELDCQAALESCIQKHLIHRVDREVLAEIDSFLRDHLAIGPIYGVPRIGEIDLTLAGARKYKSLRRIRLQPEFEATLCYKVRLSKKVIRLYSKTKKGILQGAIDIDAPNPSEVAKAATRIGPWCIYWWERYSVGYATDYKGWVESL